MPKASDGEPRAESIRGRALSNSIGHPGRGREHALAALLLSGFILVFLSTPLLRYRTGDTGTPGDGAACRCGRHLPTVGPIAGRVDEMVATPEGTAVGPAALSLAFQSVAHLRESQIIQDSADAIALKLCVTPDYRPADEQYLIAELRKRLGHRLVINLEYVPAVPRTVSGKQRLVVSSLRGRA